MQLFFSYLLLPLKMNGSNSEYSYDPKYHQAADGDDEYRHIRLLPALWLRTTQEAVTAVTDTMYTRTAVLIDLSARSNDGIGQLLLQHRGDGLQRRVVQ